jgi:hypothetical protein
MSDTEILELHNGCLRAQAKRAVEYKHVAVEVPLGSLQIEYDASCDQWVHWFCSDGLFVIGNRQTGAE